MLKALLPKGAPFFELMLQQNAILCRVANGLTLILDNHTIVDRPHREISLLEAEADTLHLTISKHLSQTFITPIDREDILHINKAQEDAIDLYYNLANRLYVFEFTRIRFPMLQLARCLNELSKLTNEMLLGLSQKRDSHKTKAFRVLCNECEMLLSMGIGELYDVKDPTPDEIVTILKWSRAYDRAEMLYNQIVLLAETIEEAVLKNV